MPLDVILERRLLIISGKGGVGKTTLAAAIGVLAARHNRKVLIAEVEGRGALSLLFGAGELTPSPTELRPELFGMNISPDEALKEYFEVQFGMKRIARPLVSSQLVEYVTHAAPGLRDILMLGKVWYEATRRRNFDLIVLDTPAAGHAVSMLRSPEGFLQAVPVGPLAGHTRQVIEWLKDPSQVVIYLVTLAEEMPVNETIETVALLEERMGIDVSAIFVNMLYPRLADDPEVEAALERLTGPAELAGASGGAIDEQTARTLYECGEFYRARRAIQQAHRGELERVVAHTAPLIDVPFLFRESFKSKELDLIADAIEARVGA